MNDIDTDALPTVSRCTDARTPEHQGFINRISNQELYERHPRYPRTAYGEPVEPKDLIHFVFVYANEDYRKFKEFSEWFEEIKKTIKNGHTVTCDDRESEMFPGNHDDNINDICERAIFILPFLSKSFCEDKVLRFFTSEAIGTTRLDQRSAQGSLENIFKKQKNDAVRPIHTQNPNECQYRTPIGLTMMKGIHYFGKKEDLERVENKVQVRRIIEESIRRFEERKTAMENALSGTDRILENFEKRFEKKYGPPPMEPCMENSLLEDTNVLSLTQNVYDVPEQQVGNVGMGEYLTLPTDGNTSLTNNALSDTPGNKQLNYAEALTNGEKKLSQTSKTAEGKTGHLSAEGRNVNDNETCGFIPATSQIDTSLETDNGSIFKNTIQNATQNTVNSQDQKSTDRAFSTDPCIGVKKDSREAVMSNHMSYTRPNIPSAVLDNAAQSKKKEKHHVESPIEKGQISEETVINVNKCGEVPISERTAICTRENRKDVQRNPANSKTRWNDTNLSTQTSESETSWNNLSLTESYSETKAKMMTTKDQDLTDRDFNVRKDSGKEVIANDLCCTELDSTDVARATGNNTVQKEIKGKQPEENPRGKGKLSGSGKGETTINYYINCETVQIGDGSTYHREKKEGAIPKNTARCGFNPNETNSTTRMKTMENEANSLIFATHPFSKGTHKQKDAIQSVGKHYVSKSVGLIRIAGRLSGTGFRVGSKYVATCYHLIKKIITASPHFIDSDQLSIEFERYTNTEIGDQNKMFGFETSIAYSNKEYDFIVLELKVHNTAIPFPPPLTCFGELCDSEIHLLGHPGGEQMKEDSEVFPKWSPKHDAEIIPQIKNLGHWSLTHLPGVNSKKMDHYGELLKLPRKILFHTTFDEGSSGSPGFIIENNNAWVILMLSGGAPGCFYKKNFNRRDWPVEDDQKVEYGYAMVDIYEQMRISEKELASDIFREWIANNDDKIP